MDDLPRSRVAPLVVAALGEESLDPAVRDLAVERLDSLLLAAVRALPFAASTARVTLSATDGVVSLTPPPDLDGSDAAALRERIDRTLLAQLAATVGVARLAVRNGERATSRRDQNPVEPPPPEPPPRWEDVVAALMGVVARQQEQLEALGQRLDAPPVDRGVSQELRRVEAMLARSKKT